MPNEAPQLGPLRQLSRGYRREPAVVEEIRALAALPEPEFWRRMAIRDYQAPDSPRLESMVYFVRQLAASQRIAEAWRIIESIEARIGSLIGGYMSRFSGLTREQAEDIGRDVVVEAYTDWLSLDPSAEFWEARFAVCLRRMVFDAVDRRKRTEANEIVLVHSAPEGTDEGLETLEALPDLSAPDPETRAMIAAALQNLEPAERAAMILLAHDGLTEDEVAKRLGVTSRTVRNYMSRARQRIRQWQEEQEDDR